MQTNVNKPNIRKARLWLIALAFVLPLFFFTAKGFTSTEDAAVWKPADGRYYMPVERSHGWEIKLKLMGLR